MTSEAIIKTKQIITQKFKNQEEQLNEELDRYVSMNDANSMHKPSFISLSANLRKAILQAGGSIKGKFLHKATTNGKLNSVR